MENRTLVYCAHVPVQDCPATPADVWQHIGIGDVLDNAAYDAVVTAPKNGEVYFAVFFPGELPFSQRREWANRIERVLHFKALDQPWATLVDSSVKPEDVPSYFETVVIAAHPIDPPGFAGMTVEHAFKRHGMVNLPQYGWMLPSGRPKDAAPVRVAFFASTARDDGSTCETLLTTARYVREELSTRDVMVIMRAPE